MPPPLRACGPPPGASPRLPLTQAARPRHPAAAARSVGAARPPHSGPTGTGTLINTHSTPAPGAQGTSSGPGPQASGGHSCAISCGRACLACGQSGDTALTWR